MVLQSNFKDLFESLPQDIAFSLPVLKENNLEIEFDKDHEPTTVYNGSEPLLPFANSDVFKADILCWKRLSADDVACKPVYEVTFDVQGSNFQFKAGDTIGVISQNTKEDVNFIINHLDLTAVADCNYKLTMTTAQKGSKIPPHIPVQSSLSHVLTYLVDLRTVLKKLFLLALSRHTTDNTERKVLEYICSKEGSPAYQTHILNTNICLLDIFTIFKSCKPPIQVLLANLPRLLPRPYSIVNSGLKETEVLKICFSVMLLENNRKGLTSGWLEKNILTKDKLNLEKRLNNLAINNNDCDTTIFNVPIYLRKNMTGFSLPENMEIPLILIGPGTGIAPFIGFLQEREMYKNKHPDTKLGDIWLFFGCRNPELDFIYEKELKDFVEKGVVKKLCTSFSRIKNCDNKYIQDALMQNKEDVAQLIQSNASIFVCGDLKNMATSMASSVKETLIQCLVTTGKSLEEASEVIAVMQKEKKYIVDAWS